MEEIYTLLIESDSGLRYINLFKLGPIDACFVKKGGRGWCKWNGAISSRVKKVTVLTDDEYFLEKL